MPGLKQALLDPVPEVKHLFLFLVYHFVWTLLNFVQKCDLLSHISRDMNNVNDHY